MHAGRLELICHERVEGVFLRILQGSAMEEPPLPDRVRHALEGAADFGQFRDKRKFVFLHLFTGPNDVLGGALKEEARKEHLNVEVQFYDKLDDHGSDLLEEQPFMGILRRAKDDGFDAGHAGFPCASFSRARLREGTGPGPVRSNNRIYGLPDSASYQVCLSGG